MIASLAREGGLQSVLWAGPEQLGAARRTGKVEGTVRTRRVSLELGFAADDFGYLVDLGMPQIAGHTSAFARDPEIKREALFAGPRAAGRHDAGAPDPGFRRGQRGHRPPVAAAIQTIIEAGCDDLSRAVADAFDGATLSVAVHDGLFDLQLRQRGMLRPLRAAELSDGTLRFLLWAAALLSPQAPSLMVLNEPETSLHPDLVRPLASLIRTAAARTQVVVVTHSRSLLEFLDTVPVAEADQTDRAVEIELYKEWGETRIVGQGLLTTPPWDWGKR